MPAARMLIATPETTWSTPKVTVATRVQQPAQRAEQDAADQRGDPAPLVAGVTGAPGAQDHHALEADVDHAGALGEQPAQGGQADRHGQQEGGRHRRRRRQRLLAADRPDQRRTAPAGRATSQSSRRAAAAAGQQVGERAAAGPGSVVVCDGAHACAPCRSSVPAVPGRAARGRVAVAAAAAGDRRRSGPRRPRSAARSASRRAISLAITTASTIVPWMIVTTDDGIVGDLQRHQRPGRGRRTAAPRGRCRPAGCGRAGRRRCRGSPARR